MNSQSLRGLQDFNNYVGLKFQLYNSLFTGLPFHRIEKTGVLLSMFINDCEEGYAKQRSPSQIVEDFFTRHTSYTVRQEQLDILFRFIQFVERQVVLFDALEDAGFSHVHETEGAGTMKHLELEVLENNKQEALSKKLEDFSVKLVLTAHPTQFYPDTVLGIINDLSRALAVNDTPRINTYLQQLGKTPFFKNEKPSPFDEAVSLIWYLENVFYIAAGQIISFLENQFPGAVHANNPIINMGFWPGGDRDGNPFVTADITLKVADALRSSIIKCYYLDIRRLKRRLTFKGIDVILNELEKQLYENIFIPGNRTLLTASDILTELRKIKDILVTRHDGLFVHLVNNLISRVHVFGLHFASLDVRQESSIHNKALEIILSGSAVFPDYASLDAGERINFLTSNDKALPDITIADDLANDTIESIRAIRSIQKYNDEAGCNRYIISQCNTALNVFEVYGLFILAGWKKEALTIDIVPLFETIGDLHNAPAILKELFENKEYVAHLKRRGFRQTIMLGFSDGTKDGGYLMANWSIYKAKEELTAVSKTYGVDVVFFDGRGGPPARGGGKTHKFYASMGKNISAKQIQLTVQGQTVSSNFGTVEAARYNIEQLIHAGISNTLFTNKAVTLEPDEEALLQKLADDSFTAYNSLKSNPHFLDYLLELSPLRFYSETNISSRPSRRSVDAKLELKDLRAIPFVGAWSQLKQNVTGYYGMGIALQQAEKEGKFAYLQKLYQRSMFFKTLIDNCEMAMTKCYFPLTAHLANDPKYGAIWKDVYEEYLRTEKYLLLLTGKELMAEYPVERLSISMREKIILPLATIQQFAIAAMRAMPKEISQVEKDPYEKLVIRCSFGIINAGRNSV